ncbi:MAG: peptidase M64 [Bacteroidia bacterium]|nr:MAG: peptidase M64 [Bacteroidia bacterium]
MKKYLAIILLILPVTLLSQISFNEYFTDKTLRFDFLLAGDSETTIAYPVGMRQEPYWAGSLNNLVEPYQSGNLRYEISDPETGIVIYSKGYGSLFQEWQTTAEAKIISRAFSEVATFPFPLNRVKFVLSRFERDGTYRPVFETFIDPSDYFIRKEGTVNAGYTKIVDSGDPHTCLDIAFIAEGYRAAEMEKFRSDVKRLSEILLSYAPFNEFAERINIWAVEAISEGSGTDIPGEGIYVNTALNSSFYTFDLDRYLTTFDISTVNDFAAVVPHDNIVVLINSERYGGGGMYNYYSGTTSDHMLTPQVFTHEFGHGLAGLADEYYTSDVAYEEFYPFSVEPWEPNITTLVNFESKWKELITEGTPTPTPAEDIYSSSVGLFEGGGYSAKGIFRPQLDCRMKSNEATEFCKVCQDALRRVLKHYTE